MNEKFYRWTWKIAWGLSCCLWAFSRYTQYLELKYCVKLACRTTKLIRKKCFKITSKQNSYSWIFADIPIAIIVFQPIFIRIKLCCFCISSFFLSVTLYIFSPVTIFSVFLDSNFILKILINKTFFLSLLILLWVYSISFLFHLKLHNLKNII